MKLISSMLVAGLLLLPFTPSVVASEDEDIQLLVDELESLTKKSRQERAADRWLQNALEDLVDKYNNPWRNSLLMDDFSDGDYQQGTVWEIGSGNFWVDRRLGLRSRVEPIVKERSSQQQGEVLDNEDLGKVLIGALLKEALGTKSNEKSATQPSQEAEAELAAIRSAVKIPTTFAVESVFSQNNRPGKKGRFEWIVMQDEAAKNAFAVIIETGREASIDIVRILRGRTSYIESRSIADLNDGREHNLSWRQKSDGSVAVFIDGKQIVNVRTQSFRYGFNYLGMINHAGDFSVSGIEVLGGR